MLTSTAQLLQARKKVPEDLLNEIKSLNRLDIELYKYGQYIFEKKQSHMMQNMVDDVRQISCLNLIFEDLSPLLSFGF